MVDMHRGLLKSTISGCLNDASGLSRYNLAGSSIFWSLVFPLFKLLKIIAFFVRVALRGDRLETEGKSFLVDNIAGEGQHIMRWNVQTRAPGHCGFSNVFLFFFHHRVCVGFVCQ